MSMLVEVSTGEYLDKISILQIKAKRIIDPQKLQHVQKELAALMKEWKGAPILESKIAAEFKQLRVVNEKLWELEDRIREKEAEMNFDAEFIDIARAVYITNDHRAEIKRTINIKLDSAFLEVKSYAGRTAG